MTKAEEFLNEVKEEKDMIECPNCGKMVSKEKNKEGKYVCSSCSHEWE